MNYIETHKFCRYNRQHLDESNSAGCFYCLKIFDPLDIDEWIDAGTTAMCPYCHIDSVIPDIKIKLTPELLLAMHKYWF